MLINIGPDLILGDLAQLQAESQIFIYRHVGPQVVALEYHGGRPLFRRQFYDRLIVDQNVAVSDIQKTADGPQNGGLSTAGWPQHGDDFAFINFQIDMLDAITVVIALCHITDFQF